MLAMRRRGWLGARLQNAASRRLQPLLRRLASSTTSPLSDATSSASETDPSPQNPGSFASLARTFSAIEDVKNSRAASVKLLADGYRALLALPTSQELASALYLTASQLAPPYEGVELRFGAKSFVRFLKQLEVETEEDSAPQQTVEKLVATFPDYGQATQALLDTGRILVPEAEGEEQEQPLSVTDVHEQLMAIAKDEGTGGVARKQQLALKLLQQCRCPDERIFLVRMLAHQNLRIGMGEKSILSALAMASSPSYSSSEAEEATAPPVTTKHWIDCVTLAYAQHPNYRVLAELVHAGQHETDIARRVQWLHNEARPAAGVPVLTMSAYPVSSVAAVLERVAKSTGRTATCEYKYDGARVQVHLSLPGSAGYVGRIFSRNMEDATERFSSLLDVLRQRIEDRKARGLPSASALIVEGEVVALDRETGTFRPFQVLQTKTTTEFCLFLFDLLAVDDTNLLQSSLRKRRALLRDLLEEKAGYVEFVKHIDISTEDDAEETEQATVVREYLEQAVASGCEGLMIKALDDEESEYKAGRRSYSWMKLKHDYLSDEVATNTSSKEKSTANTANGTFLADTLDLVPIGAFHGKGRRAGVFGSFLMATYNSTSGKFETIGKVGTGFSDAQLTEVAERLQKQVLPETNEVPEQYQSSAIRSRHPDVWLSPEEVWEIKATQLTESPSYMCGATDDAAATPRKGLALRFPRFVRYRPDKKPLQATESEQVVELFQQQQQQIPH